MNTTTQPEDPNTQSDTAPSPVQSPQQSSTRSKWFIPLGIVGFLALVGVFAMVQKSSTPVPEKQNNSQQAAVSTIQPKRPLSKAPGIITNVVTSDSINPKTGIAGLPKSTFSKSEKAIYVIADVKNLLPGKKIEYVRYLNDKYLDHKSVEILRPNTQHVFFRWVLKSKTATHQKGTYRVKLYSNGIFEKEINYTVID